MGNKKEVEQEIIYAEGKMYIDPEEEQQKDSYGNKSTEWLICIQWWKRLEMNMGVAGRILTSDRTC